MGLWPDELVMVLVLKTPAEIPALEASGGGEQHLTGFGRYNK
jgi:hypothetical protein